MATTIQIDGSMGGESLQLGAGATYEQLKTALEAATLESTAWAGMPE